ncbi:KOW motif-containing protein [Streptomyces sp. NPDC007172]|uniref:KOW motif-containing protein n=1 Tax=Streptomyces sp. NPDC007172 TaxID=3364776 RepID=UPI00369DB203
MICVPSVRLPYKHPPDTFTPRSSRGNVILSRHPVGLYLWGPYPCGTLTGTAAKGEAVSHEANVRTGDQVRVTGGPFTDFTGSVRAVDPDRGRVRLTVDLLGDVSTIDISLSHVIRAV